MPDKRLERTRHAYDNSDWVERFWNATHPAQKANHLANMEEREDRDVRLAKLALADANDHVADVQPEDIIWMWSIGRWSDNQSDTQ